MTYWVVEKFNDRSELRYACLIRNATFFVSIEWVSDIKLATRFADEKSAASLARKMNGEGAIEHIDV